MAPPKKRKKSDASDTMNKRSCTGETAPELPCRLLQIPRELRDLIYEMCLVVDYDNPDASWNPWQILINDVEIPGLLQTCRQIRAEAFQVWLFDNEEWNLEIEDCYAGHLMKWTQLVAAHTRPDKPDKHCGAVKPLTLVSGDMKMKHLQQWCQWVHEGKLEPYVDELPEQLAIATAVDLVHKSVMRSKDKPWEECKEIVNPVCGGLETFGCHFSRHDCLWYPDWAT